jgi:glycine oxidase
MKTTVDVAIIGGGVIGLAIADRLAGLGRSVLVLDAGEPGREASWAASGSLALIMPDLAPAPMRPFASKSQALWGPFAEGLEARSGMPIEYVDSGLLRLVRDEADEAKVGRTVAWLRDHDVAIDRVDGARCRALSPLVSEAYVGAYHQPELRQVRPPRLLRALLTSIAVQGGEVRGHDPVRSLLREGERVVGVRAASGDVLAGEVVLAAGVWSCELARRDLGVELPMVPVRGQMLLLEGRATPPSPLLLDAGGSYLIRRADGRILAGSTFEYAGFDRSVTAAGIHSILDGAFRIAPSLAGARLARSWTGFRPEGPDRLPYLGRIAGLSGLVVATGHFRDGILLAPTTAQVIADLVEGAAPSVDIAAFHPERTIVPVVA